MALFTALAVGSSLYGMYQSHRQAKDAKKAAKNEQDSATRQLNMLESQNAEQQRRYDENYRPIEESISTKLKAGPDLEGAASEAGGAFATQFDSSQAAQERQLRQFGIRPDSQAYGRATEDAAYNRAAGMAQSQTGARRAEEDSHFLQQMNFLQGGSGIQGEVASRTAAIYDAHNNRASAYGADAASGASSLGQFAEVGFNALGGAEGINNIGTSINGLFQNDGAPDAGMNANNYAKQRSQTGQVAAENPIQQVNS